MENRNDQQIDGLKGQGRGWRVAIFALFAVIAVAAYICLDFYFYTYGPGPSNTQAEVLVYIPPKTGVRGIKALLAEAGVIDDDIRFVVLARITGLAGKLKAGEFQFPAGSTPYKVLEDLAAGKSVLRTITITEGSNIYQMADYFAGQDWLGAGDFLQLAESPGFIKSLGLKVKNLEGYLFPDTYYFPKGEKVEEVIRKMVNRMKKVVAEECAKGKTGDVVFDCSFKPEADMGGGVSRPSADAPISVHQLLTLASIVEKETGLAAERPKVARVFLNRHLKDMKMQADPTLLYGLKKFGGTLSRKDLQTPGPYNTYLNRGLPAGPIANPGRASIAAVLRPAEGKLYYFVLQADGSHYFSKSLKEHNQAVKRYRAGKVDR